MASFETTRAGRDRRSQRQGGRRLWRDRPHEAGSGTHLALPMTTNAIKALNHRSLTTSSSAAGLSVQPRSRAIGIINENCRGFSFMPVRCISSILKPLPAPFADPAEKIGSVALAKVPAEKG